MAFEGPTAESKEAQALKLDREPDEEVLKVPDDKEREDHARILSMFVRVLGQLFTPFVSLPLIAFD